MPIVDMCCQQRTDDNRLFMEDSDNGRGEIFSLEFGKSPLFLEIREFPFNTAQDKQREASVPKTSWIRLSILTQYWRVTETHRPIANSK